MDRIVEKKVRRARRKMRVRKRVFGTPERPRLSVTRSLKHIYVQLIDDTTGSTLVSVSTNGKDLRAGVGYGGNKAAAEKIGTALADLAKAKGIQAAAFDRNGFRYHGRLKALADAARKGGLAF
jgi:large subunit ribosomal protein L18